KFGLQINAELENIEYVKAVGDDFRWYMKVRMCTCNISKCGTDTENFPLSTGKGDASLVIKCKLCKRESSLDIIEGSVAAYTNEKSGEFATIVTFDCRGVHPTDFSPRIGWEVKGLGSDAIFSDVDLSNLEWFDYDEKAGQTVSITELKYRFATVKI
ncbi:unnamed protein product, partial [Candidula unifasciata]